MGDRLTDWLFGVIARPVPTLNEIAREKPAGLGFLVYLGVTVLAGIAATFEQGTFAMLEEAIPEIGLYITPAVIIFGGIFLSVITLFVLSLVLHLFARLFGGSGGYWNFFSAFTFAGFPNIINVPVSLIAGFLGVVGTTLSALTGFGLSIWILVLHILALRESYGLSTGMSILAYFISLVLIVAVPIVITVAIVIAVIAL